MAITLIAKNYIPTAYLLVGREFLTLWHKVTKQPDMAIMNWILSDYLSNNGQVYLEVIRRWKWYIQSQE